MREDLPVRDIEAEGVVVERVLVDVPQLAYERKLTMSSLFSLLDSGRRGYYSM